MTKPAGNDPDRFTSGACTMHNHRLLLVIIVVIWTIKVKIILKRR
jgi:hypothetical protein